MAIIIAEVLELPLPFLWVTAGYKNRKIATIYETVGIFKSEVWGIAASLDDTCLLSM